MRGALLATLMLLYGCDDGAHELPDDDTDPVDEDTSPPIPPPQPPDAPSLELEVQAIKRFRFQWGDVERETEYRLLEKLDGPGEHVRVATIPADATSLDHEVFLPLRVNASYVLEACNEGGCTPSDEVLVEGDLVEAIGYVKASNPGARDEFGRSVAISGDGSTLAIGAPLEDSGALGINGPQDDDSAEDSGAVYVFTRDDSGAWAQQAYIKASNTHARDEFGWSVALSGDGNTLAVGAHWESSVSSGVDADQTDKRHSESGAVYVFTRSGGSWSQQVFIKASNSIYGDHFGHSVALSSDGHTLAVGAPRESSATTGIDGDQSDDSASWAGAVYVFTRVGGTWSQQAYVKASNTGKNDWFGDSVALSADGDTLAVGAASEDSSATGVNGDQTDNSATWAGAVYVFTRSGGTWSQQAYLKAFNTGPADNFGRSVALTSDGNMLAVGAMSEDSPAVGIGGAHPDHDTITDSGAAYLFTRVAGSWSQQAYLKAPNPGELDRFGLLALSRDGSTLVSGAPLEDSATGGDPSDDSLALSGAVYLY